MDEASTDELSRHGWSECTTACSSGLVARGICSRRRDVWKVTDPLELVWSWIC